MRKQEKPSKYCGDIRLDIEKTYDLVSEIAAASYEQCTNIGEINLSINQMNNVVLQNASIAKETAASSAEPSSQSGKPNADMKDFRLE